MPFSPRVSAPLSVKTAPQSHTVLSQPVMRSAIVAAIIFVIGHFAMLAGVTTPEKFYFDEVHYVPAARQMLEPVMREPILNPMHPPLRGGRSCVVSRGVILSAQRV